jgi:hypothetical protein
MESVRGKKRWAAWQFVVSLLFVAALWPWPARGGITARLPRDEPIPREAGGVRFKSWSLVLVCNPAWLLTENLTALLNLYRQFEAFGTVIGPTHVAVWFWERSDSPQMVEKLLKGEPGLPGPQAEITPARFIDANRSSQYCAKFRLLPSESPHVLVTTTYPSLTAPVGDHWILTLNGADSTEITALLTTLADQLLVQNLDQTKLGSKEWWGRWLRSFRTIRGSLADFMKKVTFTIDTKFFKVELAGGKS